jgi:hypothetical protein
MLAVPDGNLAASARLTLLPAARKDRNNLEREYRSISRAVP